MPIIPWIYAGLGAIAGWFFSGDKIENQNNAPTTINKENDNTIVYVMLIIATFGFIYFVLKRSR